MDNMIENNDSFYFFSDSLDVSEKSEDLELDKSLYGKNNVKEWTNKNIKKTNGRFVAGYASTGEVDSDGECMVQEGLDLTYFHQQAILNWQHKQTPDFQIAVPMYTRMDSRGFFLKSMLLENPMANNVWQLATSLKDLEYPRKLGYSVEGKVLKRSEINKSKILKAKIVTCAITDKPVHVGCTFEIVSKSFVPQSYDEVLGYIMKDMQLGKDLGAMSSVGMVAGNSFGSSNYSGSESIRTESMDRNLKNQKDSKKELEDRLFAAYKSHTTAKSEMGQIIKSSISVEAPDVLIDKVVDLILLSGGPKNFEKIISEAKFF